jgi:hypothetical protein
MTTLSFKALPLAARVSEVIATYQDASIGFAEAGMALAERLSIRRILTTDKWHFRLFRLRGLDYWELLP